MKTKAILVKAFTKDPAQGNPAGVVLAAESLSDSQRQEIARTLGFSESAFVEKSDTADYKVRFFTPTQEVDFCGHATVATFHTLVQAGFIKSAQSSSAVVTQQTGIGILPVTCFRDGRIMMTQNPLTFGRILKNRAGVAALLGLTQDQLLEQPIQVVSTGLPKLVIPVANLAVLRSIQPQLANIRAHTKAHNYMGIAVLTPESFTGAATLSARCFNPLVGINEDPATGIAAGPLACYARTYLLPGTNQFVIEQGFDMGKASTIYVDISSDIIVGGYAIEYAQKELNV